MPKDIAQNENEAGQKPPRKVPKTLLLVLGVTVAEAAAFLIIFKMFAGGPQPAHGEHNPALQGDAASQPAGTVEVQVVRGFRVPNDKSGILFLYDMDISVLVPRADQARMEGLVAERGAEIGDRLAQILRGAHDRMLREDDLRALRQQVALGLAEIARDDRLILRVLIPRFVPMRTD
ncbi:MAG: hypothetical protein IPM18_11945 [Phycisphaerales bacterium]|nr:hypothetical protein [Phycisphaerales bacterium]